MAFVLADRVKETSTTTGTGTLDLAGAVSNFQTFVAGIGDGNTTHYAIVHRSAAEWEVGLGTVTDAATDTLSRDTILASSNAGLAVSLTLGTKDVFCDITASRLLKMLLNDESATLSGGFAVTPSDLGTITTGTVTPAFSSRNWFTYVNNGAHTLAPPSTGTGTMIIDITNDAGAGAITTSGFDVVDGDSFTTTDTEKFRCFISEGALGSTLTVKAMQ